MIHITKLSPKLWHTIWVKHVDSDLISFKSNIECLSMLNIYLWWSSDNNYSTSSASHLLIFWCGLFPRLHWMIWYLSSPKCTRNTVKTWKMQSNQGSVREYKSIDIEGKGLVNPWKCHHTLGVFVWRLSVTEKVSDVASSQNGWINPGDEHGNRCYNHIACVPKSDNVTILKLESNPKQHIFFQFTVVD